MKQFKVSFIETVYYETTVEAESEEEARQVFREGHWDNADEVFREYVEIDGIEEKE